MYFIVTLGILWLVIIYLKLAEKIKPDVKSNPKLEHF